MQTHSNGAIVTDIGVTLNPSKDDGKPFAVVEIGDSGGFRIFVESAADGQKLLTAAFEAVKLLDPDGAPDALIGLIEGDALARILRRAKEEDIREALAARPVRELSDAECDRLHAMLQEDPAGPVISADAQVCFWCGTEGTGMKPIAVAGQGLKWECADAEACRHTSAEIAPDTAQPEDIPVPTSELQDYLRSARRACAECGATEEHTGPLDDAIVEPGKPVVLRCHNRVTCKQRQAAKAGAR